MDKIKSLFTIRNLCLIVSTIFFIHLIYYFYTGGGGALKLATRLVPVAVIVYILNSLQKDNLYPRMGTLFNRVIAGVYILVCIIALVYIEIEFESMFIYRAGAYTQADLVIGVMVFLLIMEISRKVHTVIFALNVFLVFYCIYGHYSPIDFFWHPGTTLTRIITVSTVEFSTGVYGRFAQMALTMISSFLLLAAVGKAFGAQQAIIQTIYRLLGKNTYSIPQVAVISSTAVGAVSGSGSANAAVTGSFTIPLMIDKGIPPLHAAGVETASSLGSLIMPPLMGMAGFLIAEFLGMTYWDVALRAFGIGVIFYSSVILTVHLISVSSIEQRNVDLDSPPLHYKLKTFTFLACIILLIVMLGVLGYGPMRAAVITATIFAILLFGVFIYFKYYKGHEDFKKDSIFGTIRTMIETHAELTSHLVILMSTIGLMIGLFTVTGFITSMGSLLMQLGSTNLIFTILAALGFGWVASMGLPPTAAYIIVAVIAAPPLISFGVNPWVAHFFVFIISVMGEFSPPTSTTSAVASKIAGTSFLRTVMNGLKICMPIFFILFSIFIRTELVVEPGLAQVISMLVISAGTCGFSFIIFGKYSKNKAMAFLFKSALAILGLTTMFHPSIVYAIVAAVIIVGLLILGLKKHKMIASLGVAKEHVAVN